MSVSNGYGYGDGSGYGYGDGDGHGDGYPEQDIGGPSLALATIYCREPRTIGLTVGDALAIGGLCGA